MKNTDFTVLVLPYGNPIPDHLACIQKVIEAGVPLIPVKNCPYLDIARSYALSEGMRLTPDAKAFVFIDHDMIFGLEAVVGLAQRLIEKDLDVSGVLYSLKKPGFALAGEPLEDKQITFYKPGHKLARYVGTGFMAINRRVVKALDEIMPEYFVPVIDKKIKMYFDRYIQNESYYPDDAGFCFRLRDLGFKIWIDTEPRIYHRGQYDYAIEDCGLTIPNYTELTVNFDNTSIKPQGWVGPVQETRLTGL